MPSIDPILVLIANYCVALLFAFASLGKMRQFRVFCATLAEYELLPGSLTMTVATIITATEFAIAIAAIIRPSAQFAMIAAVVLLTVYAAAIGINLLRGRRDIDCGCTGPATRQLLSGWLLVRNATLITLAIVGTALPTARVISAADWVLVGFAIIAAMALYAAANQLMVNAPRLDALDSIMEAG